MRALGFALAAALLAAPTAAAAQTSADSAAIRAAATDYIQGWYDADGPRMQRAVHPDLAKRIVRRDPAGGGDRVSHMDAARLVGGAAAKASDPAERRRQEITILDVYDDMASVKLVAQDWVDYLHLGRVDGKWVIVNVMWDTGPAARPRP
ncbi:MAG TPA: nuclear transport factor 2 family protein [Longimicrobiaceae bacterium]|nr:nuclear transport factor 2 family protein [Longimicrobiaceae bacterium]